MRVPEVRLSFPSPELHYCGEAHTIEASVKFITEFIGCELVEVFGVLLLSTKFRIIGNIIVSRGTINSCLVHPTQVFLPAILMNAASVLLYHNHPSGVPEPSQEDVRLTLRLQQAGVLLSIPVIDHIIVAGGSYHSFHESRQL